MKRFLPAILTVLVPIFLNGQITTPIIKANFGVDADLRANFFNGSIITGNDDWWRQNGTVGEGIIDTTGAAMINARYAIDPTFRQLPFFRGMKFPQFSVVNNRLLIDGIFIRDYHGIDSTVFASGANKNGMSPASWSCPPAQNIPDKNDILDVYMHVRRAGPTGTDSLWLFGGVSIENVTGSRYFDFEMYQTDINYDRTTQQFYGYGPDAGHTSWQFDASGNIIKPGDIIFTAEFGSAGLTLVEARIWVNSSALSLSPVSFNWGGQFDGASSGATFGYANIIPKVAGDFYTGIQCGNNTWAGDFQLIREDNSLVTTYIARQFMEFSVNLSKLGLDPYLTSNDICGLPFRRILIKSRASTSFTAELKDFVGPFDFFRAPRAKAAATFPILCGSAGITDIKVSNPLITSVYRWTTPNGHIVTSPTGPTITVDKPGMYIVSQELMDSCGTAYAKDTVLVTLDSNCAVLKTNILNFAVKTDRAVAQLKWTTSANKLASYFQVERSISNQAFAPVGKLLNQTDLETADYTFNDNVGDFASGVVYYRLRIVDINGNVSFSKIVAASFDNSEASKFVIAPNPVRKQAQFIFTSDHDTNLQIKIFNTSGELILTSSGTARKGRWMVTIPDVQQWPTGVYIVRATLGNEMLVQKLVVTK
jgi:hypothetical protein